MTKRLFLLMGACALIGCKPVPEGGSSSPAKASPTASPLDTHFNPIPTEMGMPVPVLPPATPAPSREQGE